MQDAGRPRVALAYLGCKVNQAEIEELGQEFRRAGFGVVAPGDQADVYILNSCTVTHVADRKTRLLIHQMVQRNPQALVAVTGCYASVDPSAVAAIEGVDLVIANADKARLVEIIRQHVAAGEAPVEPDGVTAPVQGRTRYLLKVQDGCDNHCTYCIVPLARGSVRSLPLAAAVEMVRRQVEAGYHEVVLTGVALGSYGREWAGEAGEGQALRLLVEAILHQTTVARLRISSVEPETVDPSLFALWSDRRLCRHLHLPLQSGCDATLKRMGRRYRTAEFAALLAQARALAPDVAVTTDMIAGFPGETEEEFAQSYAFAEAMQFAKIHVFRFSARRGTAATRLPGRVGEMEKKERSARLLELSQRAAQRFHEQFSGTTREVLWEEETGRSASPGGARLWSGLTDNYIRVYAAAAEDMRNRLSLVRLGRLHEDGMMGEIVSCLDSQRM